MSANNIKNDMEVCKRKTANNGQINVIFMYQIIKIPFISTYNPDVCYILEIMEIFFFF